MNYDFGWITEILNCRRNRCIERKRFRGCGSEATPQQDAERLRAVSAGEEQEYGVVGEPAGDPQGKFGHGTVGRVNM